MKRAIRSALAQNDLVPRRLCHKKESDDALPFLAQRRKLDQHTDLAGFDLINQPMLNKGTAFSEPERDLFMLHGLLPPHVGTLEEQVTRRLNALRGYATDFERYAFLRDLQDVNETLFYALPSGIRRSCCRSSTHPP